MSPPEPLNDSGTAEQVADRCMGAMSGAFACLCASIGHKLGLFKQLQQTGPCTSSALAAKAGLSERWVREWLYQQSAAGFVSCDRQASTFWLSDGQAAVLVENAEHPRATPLEMMCMMPTILSKQKDHCNCFKTGGGLTFDEFGTEHMLHVHRIAKAHHLVKLIQTLPGLKQKLLDGIKVADVGCGSGEIALHLASTFPNSTVVGYDISQQAIHLARQYASEQGLTNLTYLNPDDGAESKLPDTPTFHLVVIQDSLHDMSFPEAMLKAIRQSMLSSNSESSTSTTTTPPSTASGGYETQTSALPKYNGGPVLIVSDKATTGNAAENMHTLPYPALFYGFSVGLCLGSGLCEPGGAGLGTLGLSEAVARELSSVAGFRCYTPLRDWRGSGDVNAYHMFIP